jgi:DNA primase
VEGARDVMKMKQEGFKSTVGILKLDISDGQIKLLAEKTPRQVVVFLDGDKRGEEASSDIKAKLSDVFSVKIAFAPAGLDPKNMNKGGIMNTFSRLI